MSTFIKNVYACKCDLHLIQVTADINSLCIIAIPIAFSLMLHTSHGQCNFFGNMFEYLCFCVTNVFWNNHICLYPCHALWPISELIEQLQNKLCVDNILQGLTSFICNSCLPMFMYELSYTAVNLLGLVSQSNYTCRKFYSPQHARFTLIAETCEISTFLTSPVIHYLHIW